MAISTKRAESYVDFCEDLSLRGAWESAVEELERARKAPTGRMHETAIHDAARAVQKIEADMDAVTVRIHVRSLRKKDWADLAAKHPPRDDNDQDQNLSVNVSTFFDDVAKVSIFAANEKVSGEVRDFDPKAEWDDLADEMSNGQYGEFVDKFLELNRGVVGTPFSRTASLMIDASEKK